MPGPEASWGKDGLTKHLDTAYQNQHATFDLRSEAFARLVAIDSLFERAAASLNNTDMMPSVLLMRSHSAYRASAQLATATQVPEAFACLRMSLENALYAHYLASDNAAQERWLRRHDDDQTLKTVRREFQVGKLIDHLESTSPDDAATFRQLYDRAIDYGAHPNERGLSQSLEIETIDGGQKFKTPYFAGESLAFDHALRTTAQCGVCCLSLFRQVYPERFDLLGFRVELRSLKDGL